MCTSPCREVICDPSAGGPYNVREMVGQREREATHIVDQGVVTRALLRTKLFRPTLPTDFIPRPRLCDVLDRGLSAKLILVSAPAGFGKSTLVSSWLRCLSDSYSASNLRTSWLSVTESDNNLVAFWSYLVAAIDEAYPDSCTATQELLASINPPSPARLAEMLAMECQDLPGQLVLAIDDLYLVSDATVLQALAQWVDYLPPTVHLALISRVDPNIGIARLRSRQQLCEVHFGDLQFSKDEAAAFLRASLDREIPHQVAQVVQDRTEGWAVGMRLAAISLRAHTDMSRAVPDLGQAGSRFIADYLADEVLNVQPPYVQRFLIRTASLPRLCAGLCAAVLQDVDAPTCQQILDDLEQRNVFLIKLDDHRGWYRYHHQFQILLQQRRQFAVGIPSLVSDQHRMADWFAANNQPDDALTAYRAMADFDAAEALVARVLPDLQLGEDWHRLARMLDQFPIEEIRRRPGLLLARAWSQRMLFREPDVTPWVDAAEALLDADATGRYAASTQAWRGSADVLRCLSDTGIPPAETAALAERALARLPGTHAWARAMALSRLAYGMLGVQRTSEALDMLTSAIAGGSSVNNKARMRLCYATGVVQAYTGTAREFVEWAQRTRDIALAEGVWWVIPIADATIGETLYQTNEIEAARESLERVFEWEPADNFLALLPAAYRSQRMSTQDELREELRRRLERMKRTAVERDVAYALDMLAGLEAYDSLLSGHPFAAEQWAFAKPPDPRRLIAIDHVELKLRLIAELLLLLKTPPSLARACDILTGAIVASREMNNARAEMHLLVLLARVHHATGRHEAALDALERAVALGEPRGYVRCFIDAPDTVKLLKLLVRSGRCIREASRLIDAVRPDAPTPSALRAARPNVSLAEPLTEREIEILMCLAKGMTNKEVGTQLRISPLTVRNHTGHIYAKLGVATRRQAVERATTLGLLYPLAV